MIRNFQRLDTGAKIVFFGIIITLVSAFMPWYQVDQLLTEEGIRLIRTPEISSSFGLFPIFGLLSVGFAAVSLLVFTQYCLGEKRVFGFSHGNCWMACGGQALFTLLIAFSVLISQMQTDSTAEIRFGIFASVFGFFLITFGGYLYEKDRQQEEVRKSFSAPFSSELNHLNIKPEEPSVSTDQLSLSDADERKQSVLR
jgi:hypothetical protein